MSLQERTKHLDRTNVSAQPGNFETVPIIDISGLFSKHLTDRKQVGDALGDACRNVGFFYVINHRIPEQEIAKVYQIAEGFFALPFEEKSRYHLSQHRHYRGYFGIGDLNSDLHQQEASNLQEGYEIFLELPEEDPDYLDGNMNLRTQYLAR
jgi:isopenicillin N synthase-like dioxygenase